MKINNISPHNSSFLQILTNFASYPEMLYFIGKLPDTRVPTVAIIGSRKPTVYGTEVTYKLAYDLAKKGVLIISGLALGIDAIAHRAALDAGGQTMAVLANSVDVIYPASNRGVANRIIESGGAIISEYEPPTDVMKHRLLERNRIVAGLSDAVIVTEAAVRSGTLSTVASALEQGKEVFAVPGNITSPLSVGCNNLIKQGAHPATCAEDILEIIAPDLIQLQSILPLGDTPMESKLIGLIQSGIRDGDELLAQTELEVSEFLQVLTKLELDGTIRALGGNQWTLR